MKSCLQSCWIFGGAPFSGKVLLPDDAYIIAADSGYNTVKRLGFTPNLTLGDFDSLGKKPDCVEIMTVAAEKDDTDTMLAVKTALEKGYRDISIVGAIGGRLDHTFANIQSLAYILQHGSFGRLIGDSDMVELLNEGEYSYESKDGMYLSLFAYGETAVLTSRGTKYDLTEYTLDNTFPLGVSNEIIADKCSISVHKGLLLVIFSKK
ncbi:MAG: thiamine diphosphokinase [Oscillospiraceae bacterium]|nr:thiamine diphosphokinase [Oscillospiraceae bacterium]